MLKARELARLFMAQDDPSENTTGVLKTCSVRLDTGTLAYVDALSTGAGLSRNAMLTNLIELGVGSLMSELPDAIREEVESEIVGQLQEKN